MALSRVKTWAAGEVLTATDLNAEFNSILNNPVDLFSPAAKAVDMDGNELILDSDGDTSITADTDDRVDFRVFAVDVFRLNTVASAVNGIDFFAAATGNAPYFLAFGTDTNINLDLRPKGTSGVRILDKNGNEILVGADGTASAVNEITLTNAATGSGPTIEATGGDTDVPVTIKGKGSGAVIVTGDMDISGASLLGASPIVLEGTTENAFETTIAVTDPTADRTITLPNATGEIPLLESSNTFTANQTITSTDAGAGVGPVLDLLRDSASPAANDNLGGVRFFGKDSGGNTTTYTTITASVIVPTDGSEDGELRIQTIIAGTETDTLKIRAGLQMGAPTGGDKGAGTLNAASGIYDNNVKLTNRIIQVVNTQTGAVATGTTTVPNDDTIPQNTEGDEYMTLAITPGNTNNKLKIEVVVFGNHTSETDGIYIIVGLFQDTTANALAAGRFIREINAVANDGYAGGTSFVHYMTAGTTSSTTFKVRIGPSAATTFTFNGEESGRIFGGVMASSITITEISA